jgi:hypothetical protein
MKIPGSKTGRCLAAAITAAGFASVGATPGSTGPIEQEIIRNAIQNILYTVRDQIQHRRLTAPSMPGAMRFTAEESEFDNQRPFEPSAKHAFDALAYAKAPAAAAAPAPTWIYGTLGRLAGVA